MNYILFYFFLIFSSRSLASQESISRALAFDVGRDPNDQDTTCAQFKTKPVRWGLMILGSSKTALEAEKKAKDISEKVKIAYESHSFSDESYTPRVSNCDGKDCLTVEISSKYNKLTPNLFIVVGGIISKDSEKLFLKYKSIVPDTYIKYTSVKGDKGSYGATSTCLDSEIFVLARTLTFEKADKIAVEISTAVGIPYSTIFSNISTSHYYSSRQGPYPSISVEFDSAYGESENEGFLVVGAEINGVEKAKKSLLSRYKKYAPNAFKIRRARHICGA